MDVKKREARGHGNDEIEKSWFMWWVASNHQFDQKYKSNDRNIQKGMPP